ncbi:MAG: HAD family hydrolase [Solirubrobacterales bacterium]|nr:HAD family hydrolase [Solirubrobacterales bacterium]MBV9365458.1 HAD family hydrolase [Solirubrobacterales bacterium]MBV9684379.1 HAD family hydrolase [Solirubrobacterales bacterium]MBV9808371.1 HAD family hydrolase [Solirubrobacterales bacterium]
MSARIPCRAVFLDAGGVIVLPDRDRLAGALARAGIDIDPATVPRAHYLAVRALDRALGHAPDRATPADRTTRADYTRALFPQLGIVPGQTAQAVEVWERLAHPRRSGAPLWSEPTSGATAAIESLHRAGITVVIVTNSDGHAEENLAACGFRGIPVVDSTVVGAAKPDARIFHAALDRAPATPATAVHVGDTLANDVAGARAAGITPIHFDPLRACRARDHRHVRSLAGIRRHIAPLSMTHLL